MKLKNGKERKYYLVNVEAKSVDDAAFAKSWNYFTDVPEYDRSEYKLLVVDNVPPKVDGGLF